MSGKSLQVQWLYYAYFDTIPTFTVPDNPLKISGKFKGWISQVIPGGIQTNKAIFAIRQNISNAKAHCELDENHIPTLFSTNMFMLAEDLLPLIDEEMGKMIEVNNDNKRKGKHH